ncbi:hypothetical protein [Plantactinospora mayteni]|uniref:hypothetical protein n=1 Tax=Plantactinospora mayteni TaxID=566021 RepID=UPI001940A634|nr:hypothetical protein [Plantactinospora mayteni]
MQLGALTALAVTLSGCNQVGDDDDCDSRKSTPRPRSLALAAYAPATVPATVAVGTTAGSTTSVADVLPERGGFGTHLASCGG